MSHFSWQKLSLNERTDYEYERHARAIQNGRLEDVQQDTLGWNVTDGQTFKMRSKEDAIDYRYMPDPNLRPVSVTEVGIQLYFCKFANKRVERTR